MTPAAAQALLEASPPRKILVVQTAFLGDVVFTSPLVRALDRRFPDATLALAVSPRGDAVARHTPGVDEVVVVDKRGRDRSPLALWRLARAIHADLAVVPHPSWRSAMLARWSGARLVVGSEGGLRGSLFDLAVGAAGGFVASQLRLAEAVGAPGEAGLALQVAEAERAEAGARLGPGRFAGAVIGSEWATKRLPPRLWGALIGELAERGTTAVLLGAPSERALAQEVLANVPRGTPVVDQVGDSLDQALGTLACCSVVIGGDTGLVHAGRALGVPAVALFGPTDPARHAWEPSTRVIRLGLGCSPCHAHGPARCPLGHHDCMVKMSAAGISAAAADLARGRAA